MKEIVAKIDQGPPRRAWDITADTYGYIPAWFNSFFPRVSSHPGRTTAATRSCWPD